MLKLVDVVVITSSEHGCLGLLRLSGRFHQKESVPRIAKKCSELANPAQVSPPYVQAWIVHM